jgi:hypothetical protein
MIFSNDELNKNDSKNMPTNNIFDNSLLQKNQMGSNKLFENNNISKQQ